MTAWIGLISPQGRIEYNARFVIGDKAEQLEHGKWYTNQDLIDIAGWHIFLKDASGASENNVKRWRCEKL